MAGSGWVIGWQECRAVIDRLTSAKKLCSSMIHFENSSLGNEESDKGFCHMMQNEVVTTSGVKLNISAGRSIPLFILKLGLCTVKLGGEDSLTCLIVMMAALTTITPARMTTVTREPFERTLLGSLPLEVTQSTKSIYRSWHY